MPASMKCLLITLIIGIFLPACKKDAIPLTLKNNEPTVIPPHLLIPVTAAVNSTIGGFYAGLPYNYNTGNKKHPLLIFIPGGGQIGNGSNDLPLLLNDGIAQLLDEKKFPPVVTVNDTPFSFIVLSPQYSRYPAVEEIKSFLDYALENYRIDEHRVYISGLSIGGSVTCDAAAAYSSTFAAIVPISGVASGVDLAEKCKKLADANEPIWIFHNTDDPLINVISPKQFFSLLNSFNPLPPPRLTLFNAAKHDAWTKALDPSYKENNMNIYEWMLQFRK